MQKKIVKRNFKIVPSGNSTSPLKILKGANFASPDKQNNFVQKILQQNREN